jgi:hypothetical protein
MLIVEDAILLLNSRKLDDVCRKDTTIQISAHKDRISSDLMFCYNLLWRYNLWYQGNHRTNCDTSPTTTTRHITCLLLELQLFERCVTKVNSLTIWLYHTSLSFSLIICTFFKLLAICTNLTPNTLAKLIC